MNIFRLMRALALIVITTAMTGGGASQSWAQHGDSASVQPRPLEVAVLVFEGVELLDFAGPGETFAVAMDANGNSRFSVHTVGLSRRPIVSQGFLTVTPERTIASWRNPDVIVVPGGDPTPLFASAAALAWLRDAHARGALILSICNGATVLARAGLMDRREATTHHGAVDLLRWMSPTTVVHNDRRIVDSGDIVTSGGISAGIDGALYMVARLTDIDTARRAATHMEYDQWRALEPEVVRLQASSEPVKSVPGYVYRDPRDWAVYRLFNTILDRGVDAAMADYPAMYAAADGHDREMIAEPGMIETAQWLLENGSDPNISARILQFVVAAYPNSESGWENLARAQTLGGQPEAARASYQRCATLNARNRNCRRGAQAA
jgi:putative intracellular protease/amidase